MKGCLLEKVMKKKISIFFMAVATVMVANCGFAADISWSTMTPAERVTILQNNHVSAQALLRAGGDSSSDEIND